NGCHEMGKKKSRGRSTNKITPETKRILVEAVDQAFGSLNFPAIDEARLALRDITEGDLSEADPENVFRSTVMISLLDYIESRDEPTPEELREILEKFKTLPFEFRSVLDKMTKSVKQNLPRKPGGGRTSSLTLDQKKAACAKMGQLLG